MIDLLNSQGFVFKKFDPSIIDHNDLEASAVRLKELVSSMLSVEGESLYHDIDTIMPGQEIKPHYHVVPGSFQVVVWIPVSPFEGRHFLFGTKEELRRYKPLLGTLCFMKPNDPNFIHGVSKLTSSAPVKTIGFSSLVARVTGNQDIYVPHSEPIGNTVEIDQLIH